MYSGLSPTDFGQKIIFSLLIAGFCLFTGGTMFWNNLLITWQGIESSFYTSQTAVVLNSKIEQEINPRFYSAPRLCVSYSYNDKSGKPYTGDQFNVAEQCKTFFKISELKNKQQLLYSQDQVIMAYYNPSNPQRSVIKNGLQLWSIGKLLLSPFLFIIGLLALRYFKDQFRTSAF